MARRDLGVDAARGVAVLSMYVAHTAPSDGPAKILMLSEFLTAPLFAVLIGMGATFASSRENRWRSAIVRSVVIAGVGIWLAALHSQIVIVLVWLAVLTVAVTLLARAPSWLLALLVVALYLVEPPLMRVDPPAYGTLWFHLWEFGIGTNVYRMTAMLMWGLIGVLLARLDRLHRPLLAGAALAGAAVLFGADKAGIGSLDPYTGTYQEIGFNALLAVGVVEVVRWIADRIGAVPGVRPVVDAVAGLGRMSLSLYALQVIATVLYLKTGPATGRDDSWAVLAGLIVGSFVVVAGWRGLVRVEPFRRGPLEGLVAWMSGRVVRAGGIPS